MIIKGSLKVRHFLRNKQNKEEEKTRIQLREKEGRKRNGRQGWHAARTTSTEIAEFEALRSWKRPSVGKRSMELLTDKRAGCLSNPLK
jgi:hypothetical protein